MSNKETKIELKESKEAGEKCTCCNSYVFKFKKVGSIMKKHRLLFCAMLCMVLQLACTTFVSAKKSSETENNAFWEDYIFYHIIGDNEVEPVAMDGDYAEAKGYCLQDPQDVVEEPVTFEYPSSVVHDGVTYKVKRLPDYESVEPLMKGDLKIVANGWGEFMIASDEIPYPGVDSVCLNCLDGVTKVVLPDTLEYIGSGSLVECSNLEEVEFAGSYDNLVLGDFVFGGKKMKKIVLPQGTTKLGDTALGFIPDITIPSSVNEIGSYVVNHNTKKVTIDSGNKKFKMKNGMLYSKDETVLYGASGKIKPSVKISSKTKVIKPCAFAYSKVREVRLSTKVTKLSSGVFAGCDKLTKVTGTQNVKSIEYGAFGYCGKLKSIGKMSKLKSIAKASFWGCDKLDFKPGKKVKVSKYAFSVNGK